MFRNHIAHSLGWLTRLEWLARRSVALGLGLLAVAVSATPARAGEDLTKDIAQALDHVDEERWERGIEALKALFADHEGSPALRAELPRLEEALKLCLFRNGRRMPSGEDLFGSDVKRFQHGSRVLHMVGRGLSGRQWETFGEGGLSLFLPVFDGHVTLSVTTSSANVSKGRLLFLVSCWDPEKRGGYVVHPGFSQQDYKTVDAQVVRHDDDGEETLASEYPKDGTTGTFVVEKRYAALRYKFGSKTRLTANDDTYMRGHVGVSAPNPVERWEVKGKLDKLYMRKVVGEHFATAFAAWEKSEYDRTAHLPAWVRTENVPTAAQLELPKLPDTFHPKSRERATRHVQQVLNGSFVEALLVGVEAARYPDGLRQYLSGLVHWRTGAFRLAAAEFDELLGMQPGFRPAQAMRSVVRYHQRDVDDARKELEALAANGSTFSPVYTTLAQIALHEHDVKRAYELIARASAAGVTGGEFERIRRYVVRAHSGPRWARKFEKETEHFHVMSDHSQLVCTQVAQLLEKTRRYYEKDIRPIEGTPFKSRVYVFSGHAGYMDYTSDLEMRAPMTAGLYSPVLRELLLWVPALESDLWDTVRHEGFHQFLHHFLDAPPFWFNEGWAEYFGGTGFGLRREDRSDFAAYVRDRRSVAELMRLAPHEFMADPVQNYAQSDDLVRFLRETKHPKLEGKLAAYFDALFDGADGDEAYEKVFAPVAKLIDIEFGSWLAR